MAKSDIILNDNRVSVVGGGGGERDNDGDERGDLEVTAGDGKDPSIRLNADWANLVLGGGEGKSTEGDLKIRDSGDRNRIVATAENNNSADDDTRVWMNGANGSMTLGSAGEPRIRLDGTEIGRDASQDRGRIGLLASYEDGRPGEAFASAFIGVNLSETAGIAVGNRNTDGAIVLSEDGVPATWINGTQVVVGNRSTAGGINVYGGDGDALTVRDSGGNTGAAVDADGRLTLGTYSSGGEVLFRDESGKMGAAGKYEFFLRSDGEKLEIAKNGPDDSAPVPMLVLDGSDGTVKVRSGGSLTEL
jgi:hypothetical protein